MEPPNHFDEILLVEDNPGDVRLIKEMLKEGGLAPTVHVVTDGADALAFLHGSGDYSDTPRPDAILLDLHLPRKDGEEVLAEMNDDVKDIPTIVLSGSQQGADLKLNDIEDEVDACVEKPLAPDTFKQLARSLQQ
ncbi:response regulator [Natronorubrum sp. JWXQ-INN-674]|uniref:Response regulator n=1 Tax=Natronorubrum halalkaliphilum TaxID=2691917 RepID=A0A6B0VI77_9EURY|nr:response regulator [Natronorubrum halalkaliphilum]MXV61268.1 response regulator [Natronorubrum halalkaliphilum]